MSRNRSDQLLPPQQAQLSASATHLPWPSVCGISVCLRFLPTLARVPLPQTSHSSLAGRCFAVFETVFEKGNPLSLTGDPPALTPTTTSSSVLKHWVQNQAARLERSQSQADSGGSPHTDQVSGSSRNHRLPSGSLHTSSSQNLSLSGWIKSGLGDEAVSMPRLAPWLEPG